MPICTVVGARPNFMKIVPVVEALSQRGLPHFLVHTGQHYDANMSQVFFDELALPRPDIYLGVGSDTHGRQTARIMTAFEEICEQRRPELLIVSGDVNSTLAAALVASKLGIPIAHVESGLRSFDRSMPEEINRVLTDHLADLLFTTEQSGNDNLLREGIDPRKIHLVGSCMVDTLMRYAERAISREPWRDYGVEPGQYVLTTLHRPANVDERETLTGLIGLLSEISEQMTVIFPVHPRTRARLEEWNIAAAPTLRLEEPMPYITFVGLTAKARCVLTDSGGVQEETSALGIPCLTLRTTAEHLITLEYGMNRLVGSDPEKIRAGFSDIMNDNWQQGTRPPLWDGHAGERIGAIIEAWLKR